MSDPVKVQACGSVVQLDFGDGDGFEVQGLSDSITLPPSEKSVINTPDLTCAADADVGSEQPTQGAFGQYWDPQETIHSKVELNYTESISDPTKKNITVQVVSPTYTTGAAASVPAAVTWEYTAQIVSWTPEELQPEGHYKRTVNLLRKSAMTKTVA